MIKENLCFLIILFVLACYSNIANAQNSENDKSNVQPTMKITDKRIVKSATVKCQIDTAWWKWTTHEGLLTFFGADNKIELLPGGAFEIYFNTEAPQGLRGSEGCKVLSYLPKQMLSFSWNAPPSLMEARESGYYTWVVVNFKSVSGSETEITLNHLGWPEGIMWEAVYNYFDKAWGTVMNWLNESCAKMK
jgi:uncharacterized protein YndB with AHSA1/START domain